MDLLVSTGKLFFVLVAHILVSLIVFAAVIAVLVFSIRKPMRKHKPFDMAVFDKVNRFVSPRNNRFILFITYLGNHKFLIPANLLLIFYFLFIKHQNWFSVRVTAIALSSLILMFLLKWLFKRKRPLSPLLKAAKGLSFPSGHSIMSVSFFGLLIYWALHSAIPIWLKVVISALLVILILLIGFSRIYLRVHYFSDVMAGLIIGVIWLLISLVVVQKVEETAISSPMAPLVSLVYHHS